MKIVFMGTPDFAVPSLQKLIDAGHEISLVVTQPDRPKGRGKKMMMSPVKELALKYDLPISQPERVKKDEEFYKHIKTLNPDVIVVIAFGQILPQSILDLPSLGCINIHGSLLPEYRGAAPIQWSIINQEKVTGVTVQYMDIGVDTGDMLLKKEMPIVADETYKSLHDKMMYVGADALMEAMPMIESGGKERQKQDDAKATYAPMISKTLGEVDWNKSAGVLDALIRGVNPWPAAYTLYEGQIMKIWRATANEKNSDKQPGEIVEVTPEGIVVQTANGQLIIHELQVPNKKRMEVSEYIKGNTIEEGQILGK